MSLQVLNGGWWVGLDSDPVMFDLADYHIEVWKSGDEPDEKAKPFERWELYDIRQNPVRYLARMADLMNEGPAIAEDLEAYNQIRQ